MGLKPPNNGMVRGFLPTTVVASLAAAAWARPTGGQASATVTVPPGHDGTVSFNLLPPADPQRRSGSDQQDTGNSALVTGPGQDMARGQACWMRRSRSQGGRLAGGAQHAPAPRSPGMPAGIDVEGEPS